MESLHWSLNWLSHFFFLRHRFSFSLHVYSVVKGNFKPRLKKVINLRRKCCESEHLLMAAVAQVKHAMTSRAVFNVNYRVQKTV